MTAIPTIVLWRHDVGTTEAGLLYLRWYRSMSGPTFVLKKKG